jgi:TusA-related sulfurtransferase
MPGETTLVVTGPVQVTIPLPESFVGDNTEFSIKHEKGNKSYYYDGTVEDNVLTFQNPHGFSTFVISTTNPSVAKIGTTGYTSLQDAIDDAEDGDTITVLAGAETTVRTTKSINLKSGTNTALTVTVNGTPVVLNADGTAATVTGTNTGSIGGGGGGGSSSSSTYTLTIAGVQGGKVTASESKVAEGDQVTLTVTPDTGKELDTLTITDESGNKIVATKNADGTYTFTMPGSKVTITATFKDAGEDGEPTHNFTDVDKTKWYNTAVEYVARKGIM